MLSEKDWIDRVKAAKQSGLNFSDRRAFLQLVSSGDPRRLDVQAAKSLLEKSRYAAHETQAALKLMDDPQ